MSITQKIMYSQKETSYSRRLYNSQAPTTKNILIHI